jgi:hypothetical protein
LVAPSRAGVPDGHQASGDAGDCDRRTRGRAGIGERPRRRAFVARPSPVSPVTDAERDPGAAWLQAGTERRGTR